MNSSFLIGIYDDLYSFDLKNRFAPAKPTKGYKELNITPPLKNGIAAHEQSECFYFGEYVNDKQRPIRIFRISNRGTKIECAFEFPKGQIKHVHNIIYDSFRNRLWVTTGDKDNESGIFYTDDEFNTLIKLGGGDQSWRAVSVIPRKNDLIWGMDAGKDAPSSAINKIYKYNFNTKEKTEEAIIGNPAYLSIQSECGNIFMGINFEPGRKQDTIEQASIWAYGGKSWSKIRAFPYQEGTVKGSKYGFIYLPSGIFPENHMIYAALNIRGRKYASYLIKTLK